MDGLSQGTVGLIVWPDPYINIKLTPRKGSCSAVALSKLESGYGEGQPGDGSPNPA